MNAPSLTRPVLLVALGGVLVFGLVRGCGSGGIDRTEAAVRADSTRIAKALADDHKKIADSLASLIPDTTAVRAREDSIRSAALVRGRAAEARAQRARLSAAQNASDLREALTAARMEVWVPAVDALESAVDSVAVAMAEERDVAVGAERAIGDSLRVDLSRARMAIAASEEAHAALTSAFDVQGLETTFWRETAESLDGFRLFGIPVGCTAGLGAAVGAGGYAAGLGATCGVRF